MRYSTKLATTVALSSAAIGCGWDRGKEQAPQLPKPPSTAQSDAPNDLPKPTQVEAQDIALQEETFLPMRLRSGAEEQAQLDAKLDKLTARLTPLINSPAGLKGTHDANDIRRLIRAIYTAGVGILATDKKVVEQDAFSETLSHMNPFHSYYHIEQDGLLLVHSGRQVGEDQYVFDSIAVYQTTEKSHTAKAAKLKPIFSDVVSCSDVEVRDLRTHYIYASEYHRSHQASLCGETFRGHYYSAPFTYSENFVDACRLLDLEPTAENLAFLGNHAIYNEAAHFTLYKHFEDVQFTTPPFRLPVNAYGTVNLRSVSRAQFSEALSDGASLHASNDFVKSALIILSGYSENYDTSKNLLSAGIHFGLYEWAQAAPSNTQADTQRDRKAAFDKLYPRDQEGIIKASPAEIRDFLLEHPDAVAYAQRRSKGLYMKFCSIILHSLEDQTSQ